MNISNIVIQGVFYVGNKRYLNSAFSFGKNEVLFHRKQTFTFYRYIAFSPISNNRIQGLAKS